MEDSVDISSYILDDSKRSVSRQSRLNPTSRRTTAISSITQNQNMASHQSNDRQTPLSRRTTASIQQPHVVQSKPQRLNSTRKESQGVQERPFIKPPTQRSNSICSDRRVTIGANVVKTNRQVVPVKNSQNWTNSLRGNTSTVENTLNQSLSESKTEKLLREELSRLRATFETYRKDCNSKFERLTSTNASFMDDLHELKNQLDATNSRIEERERYSRRYSQKPELKTDKLIDEVSSKLLESLEFRDKVIELVEEHNKFNQLGEVAEIGEEKSEESEDEYHDANLTRSFKRENISRFSMERNFNLDQNSPRRKTTILDESWVQQKPDVFNDSVEIIEDLNSPFGNKNDNLFARKDAPTKNVSHNSFIIEKPIHQPLGEENPLNLTFTISESDCEDFDEKENSAILRNLPVIVPESRLTRSKNSPKPTKETIRRHSTAWNVDFE